MVSVIIPIYNVERYIGRCVKALMEQTLHDVEYIFVNDATPDSSIEVLQTVISQYPYRKGQVRIINHDCNRGLPAARNTGLAVATGEYIFHCDSDDFVELDMLELLYEAAKCKNADIVWCDWYLSFEKNERYMKQPEYVTPIEALKGMLSGVMKYNVWNKLVKRSIYEENDIRFPAGYGMGEDMTMMMLFVYAHSVAYVHKALYHYVKLNTNAFSQVHSEKHFADLKYNLLRFTDFLQDKYIEEYDEYIAFLKLEAKFPFLIMTVDKKMYEMWKQWFPEANKYIWENKNVAVRTRFLEWMAAKNQFWFVRLYYYVVIRFVYGIIYK